jgi:poly(A) polymerase
MIRNLIRKVFGSRAVPRSRLKIIRFEKHGIARERVSSCALRVTDTLQSKGHAAFIVGGAVRDLVLGLQPKDFDVATDATPEQVRAVFRRSRIIGRRFRLVHVMCGADTVEVSTFRGRADAEGDAESEHSARDEHGRILRDNVFGSQEEDAVRRDFTINAMFYNPATQEIWDYQNGYADLSARRVRMIGDPDERFREDPVRMLRAVRLAAKLGLEIDPRTRAPIMRMAPLVQNVPASRVFDEMLKLLLSGRAKECVIQLRKEGLHHGLLPMLDVILEQPMGERFVMLALENTDQRIGEDKPVSPGFLFAALLWHEVLAAWKDREAKGMKPMLALQHAMDDVLAVQEQKLAIPRRYDAVMREIWSMQPRFENRTGRRPFTLIEHPRFRSAYDFLILRCASHELPADLGKWWERFQHAAPEERNAMLLADGPRKRRRRRRRRPAGEDTAVVEPPGA